ncbi:conserved hypothetical protein [Xanthomonas citri pv. fuscans]|nr:conserved hypothetical protein [Xanthomonas citri pv. fuscans]SOO07861.1 conserved hypothetical protein [Xanthomonas citri pv. fuscans]
MSTARMTRSRVASRTLPVLLTTRETVIGETFASAATSSMVVARLVRRTDFLTFSKRGLFKCVRKLRDARALLR